MADLLADTVRRAAHGKHTCQLCLNPIAARERYRDVRIADDGTVYTWREHLGCGTFMLRHIDPFDMDDGYDAVMYADAMAEHEAGMCSCQDAVEVRP